MPNGKKLADCTLSEIMSLTKLFMTIIYASTLDAGAQLGDLDEEQVSALGKGVVDELVATAMSLGWASDIHGHA